MLIKSAALGSLRFLPCNMYAGEETSKATGSGSANNKPQYATVPQAGPRRERPVGQPTAVAGSASSGAGWALASEAARGASTAGLGLCPPALALTAAAVVVVAAATDAAALPVSSSLRGNRPGQPACESSAAQAPLRAHRHAHLSESLYPAARAKALAIRAPALCTWCSLRPNELTKGLRAGESSSGDVGRIDSFFWRQS